MNVEGRAWGRRKAQNLCALCVFLRLGKSVSSALSAVKNLFGVAVKSTSAREDQPSLSYGATGTRLTNIGSKRVFHRQGNEVAREFVAVGSGRTRCAGGYFGWSDEYLVVTSN
jgi:hypothetical protein